MVPIILWEVTRYYVEILLVNFVVAVLFFFEFVRVVNHVDPFPPLHSDVVLDFVDGVFRFDEQILSLEFRSIAFDRFAGFFRLGIGQWFDGQQRRYCILFFEDRPVDTVFIVPDNCRKIFLEQTRSQGFPSFSLT